MYSAFVAGSKGIWGHAWAVPPYPHPPTVLGKRCFSSTGDCLHHPDGLLSLVSSLFCSGSALTFNLHLPSDPGEGGQCLVTCFVPVPEYLL